MIKNLLKLVFNAGKFIFKLPKKYLIGILVIAVLGFFFFKPKDIRNQFLIEAATLSALGGIIGIILGFGFSLIIGNFFTTTVPLWSVAFSFGFSMLVGVIFGVAPAIRAARLDPITALRYE